MKHYLLKDPNEMKTIVISTINQEYWEITPKSRELESKSPGDTKESEYKQPVALVSKLLGGLWKPLPEISYTLGNAHSYFSGGTGRDRLVNFLFKFEKCKDSESVMALLNFYRKEFSTTQFALTLARCMLKCAVEVDAGSSLTTEEASKKLEQVLLDASGYVRYREHEALVNSTPVPY